MSFPILSLLILTPIIGALTLSLSSSSQLKNKTIFLSGLWITTGEFLLSLLLPIFYDKTKMVTNLQSTTHGSISLTLITMLV